MVAFENATFVCLANLAMVPNERLNDTQTRTTPKNKNAANHGQRVRVQSEGGVGSRLEMVWWIRSHL